MDVLADKNCFIHKTHNNRVKNYIRSLGQKAKTDAIDAKNLARYGQERWSELRKYEYKGRAFREIKSMLIYMMRLQEQRVEEHNRSKSGGMQVICENIQEIVNFFNENITKLKQSIKEKLHDDSNLCAIVDVLQREKGVGWMTAVTLAVFVPELGKISRREIALLCGVAPFANDSGKTFGKRHCYYGRQRVKSALFMAILSAIRYNKDISAKYNELLKHGKCKK